MLHADKPLLGRLVEFEFQLVAVARAHHFQERRRDSGSDETSLLCDLRAKGGRRLIRSTFTLVRLCSRQSNQFSFRLRSRARPGLLKNARGAAAIFCDRAPLTGGALLSATERAPAFSRASAEA